MRQKGVKQDYEEAVKWYLKASKQNNALAYKGLADCYKNGHGVDQNLELAEEYYQKAEELN